jgi:hypothetical protein
VQDSAGRDNIKTTMRRVLPQAGGVRTPRQ